MAGGMSPRRKGAGWERDVVNWLRLNGWPFAERRIMGMADDRGDVLGLPGVVIDCKNANRHDLGDWTNQLEEEIVNAGADTGFLVVKRRGITDVGRAYVVQPLWRHAALLKEAGR